MVLQAASAQLRQTSGDIDLHDERSIFSLGNWRTICIVELDCISGADLYSGKRCIFGRRVVFWELGCMRQLDCTREVNCRRETGSWIAWRELNCT
jgi:hypothetical protein